MGPEILIVGDRSHRGALVPRVQDLGYTVTPVRERELSSRVAAAPAPAAVLVCLGEADAAALVAAIRSGRDDVPVVLYGQLGGELRDLADVLELGADNFLAAPVSDEELARVLAELVGPGAPDDDGSLNEDDEIVRPLTGPAGRDPVLGQLHRTLESLAARLKAHESSDSEPDALDLESLGLDAVPDVDRELSPPDAEVLLTDPESSDPAAARRPEPTQRLSYPRPRVDDARTEGAMHGEDTLRLRGPVQEDRSLEDEEADGSSGHVPGDRSSGRPEVTARLSGPERRTGPGDTTARLLAPRAERAGETTARLPPPTPGRGRSGESPADALELFEARRSVESRAEESETRGGESTQSRERRVLEVRREPRERRMLDERRVMEEGHEPERRADGPQERRAVEPRRVVRERRIAVESFGQDVESSEQGGGAPHVGDTQRLPGLELRARPGRDEGGDLAARRGAGIGREGRFDSRSGRDDRRFDDERDRSGRDEGRRFDPERDAGSLRGGFERDQGRGAELKGDRGLRRDAGFERDSGQRYDEGREFDPVRGAGGERDARRVAEMRPDVGRQRDAGRGFDARRERDAGRELDAGERGRGFVARRDAGERDAEQELDAGERGRGFAARRDAGERDAERELDAGERGRGFAARQDVGRGFDARRDARERDAGRGFDARRDAELRDAGRGFDAGERGAERGLDAGERGRGDVRRGAGGAARDVRRDGGETTARLAGMRSAPVRRPRVDLSGAEPLVGVEILERLWQLHSSHATGRLIVGFTDGAIKQVWWRRGEPIYAASSASGDGLLARLQARGLLARAQLGAAARVVDDDLAGSARRLVQAGLLKPREQQEAVRDAVRRIVESLCADAAERWRFDGEPAPAEVAPGGGPLLGLLAAGARLGLGIERLREALPEDTGLRVEFADVEALAVELDWPDADTWLGLLDGSRSLAQLVAEDGLDERELWTAGCVLLAAGLAAAVEPDADSVLVEIDRRRIDERLALARDSDYFALLGVGPEAGRAEVLRAHADLRDTFADERLEPRTRDELADALAELHAALDEARDVLLDEVLRAAYLAQLIEPGES